MTLAAGPSEHFLRGAESPAVSLQTYNGASPGPLLRGRQGETMRVRLLNEMTEPTSVHWHGVRVDNPMDGASGVTQPAVPPGGQFDYDIFLPDAGTFWYHAHHESWKQVAQGLYGPLIVDSPDDPPVDRDLSLVIDDWKMDAAGGLDEESFGQLGEWSHGGRLGNWITVNSEPAPAYTLPAGGRVRLRLINAANARIFTLNLPAAMEARIVALDGMPVAPRDFPARGFALSPAQRVDVVADLPAKSGGVYWLNALFGNGDPVVAATFFTRAGQPDLVEKVRWPSPAPAPMPSREGAVHASVHMTGGAMGGMAGAKIGGKMLSMRELVAQGKFWAFNGAIGGPDMELMRLRQGQTAVLRVENGTVWPHAMHLHGHHFYPVSPDGGVSDLRDTHLMHRDESVDLVFTAGKPGKWLFHCHMLEHQAAGMGGVVTVV